MIEPEIIEPKEYLHNIDKNALGSLPNTVFKGEIIVVDNAAQTESAVEYLSQFNILGFDTETKPVFIKGIKRLPALLQLSTDNRAYLFRLNATGIPSILSKLLENKNIIKVGAAVHDDIKGLIKLKKMKPAGFVDLQNIVENYGIMEKSVQKIAAIVLNVRISKSQQLSNWASSNLTLSQQIYAATDAWICRKIYVKLHENVLNSIS
ncbi:MAG: 3'-5' exonuclease domain-containing protein 2 [Prevotellaceae bacterium]|jgi:ribonuclease D|nr:3'-5' exonuclease domain-containing protein 2 [Prevotellaceae bacterium]